MAKQPHIVVLISGSGSNLQAIINAARDGLIPGQVVGVISNRADAYGLQRAQQAGIATRTLDHKAYDDREAFDIALAQAIDEFKPDLIILAGFMRILTAAFVQKYLGKLINIHPSLLPKYPGLNTHQRAIDAGDERHGASVHFVIPELDAGPVIVQGSIETRSGESADELASRVLSIEHRIYPLAAKWLLEERISFDRGLVIMDGEPLGENGYQFTP